MTLDMRYPTPLPSTKGWGPGWPNCNPKTIAPHPIFQGGVNEEVLDLVDMLVAECQRRGYLFHPGWSWGYGCRATKGGSGDVPSFHSWGLALDFNAPQNVFGGTKASSDLATKNRWVVALMAQYGWFWLGPSIGDWMHFSFTGSPKDARAMTVKARAAFSHTVYTVDGKDYRTRVFALAAASKALKGQKAPGKVCVRKASKVG